MLPLSLLTTAQGHPMLVELKSGETYNGHLVSCDSWMNIILREVICTSKDGDRFWRIPECYVRGNNIKYLRIPDEIIDMVREENYKRQAETSTRGGAAGAGTGGRGAPGGRGGYQGRGGGRGGASNGAPGQGGQGPQGGQGGQGGYHRGGGQGGNRGGGRGGHSEGERGGRGGRGGGRGGGRA